MSAASSTYSFKQAGGALGKGGVQSAQLDGSAVVCCTLGSVWVTGPGIEDVVLGARECVEVRGRGRVVVQGLEAAEWQMLDIDA